MSQQTVDWLHYRFFVHRPYTNWADVGGLYIFSYVTESNEWCPLYVGETKSLSDRIPGHEKWREAVTLGATHIHAKAESSRDNRLRIERELIQAYQPYLNEL